MVKDPIYVYTEEDINMLMSSDNRVYGSAKHFVVRKTVLTADKIKGDSGEQAVAGLLNLWAIANNGYVFHTLTTHDGTPGETDHVALRNSTVIIMETKTFSGYTHIKVTKNGTVYGTKEGREHKLSDNKLARKVELYQRRFPQLTVKGLLVVAGYETSFSTEHPFYTACGLEDFHSIMTSSTETSNMNMKSFHDTVKFFARLCVQGF